MATEDIKVIKRDGSIVDYDESKILKAIKAAFESTNEEYSESKVKKFVKAIAPAIRLTDDSTTVTIEQLQNMVENWLIRNNYFQTAKSYILYREQHANVRRWVTSQIDFIERYKKSSNTANATIDDNSNVNSKNVGILNIESHKADNIQTSRGMIEKKLRELYPDFDAKQYTRDLESHIIYKHDESTFNGAIAPYTYSSKEVVEVKYNNQKLLLPLDLLYNIIEEPEIEVEEGVFRKFTDNLEVRDINGYTNVSVITKKVRHRDLVRVKTAFGEDLVVTDNHPLIIDKDNIESTIQAKDAINFNQYKIGDNIEFIGNDSIDLSTILPCGGVFDNFINYDTKPIRRHLKLDRDFGFVVGFFIGDGAYLNTDNYINFTQKDINIFNKINCILFEKLGIIGTIRYKDNICNCYVLEVRSHALFEIFRNYFKIQDKAQNKTLPINILNFNEEFARGVIEGLIESDGTVYDNHVSIRLSSRACILQLSSLLRYFGASIGNTIQSLPFNCNKEIKTNYTVWGVNFTKTANLDFSKSIKWQNGTVCTNTPKYKKEGYVKILSVSNVEQSSFLEQNNYIYDITTDTHTFAMNNILVHNCVSVTMYPFLTDGIKKVGGLSASPKNLDSFCGIFVNLVHAISGQFAGAVATSEFLLYFAYFCKKEWGEDFWKRPDTPITINTNRPLTIKQQIHQYFQQIVYTINQPIGARGMQAVFWNVSYFDKEFFEGMFGDFVFPDMTKPDWESLNWIQREFMQWFNAERLKCILTFPVESFALVYKDGHFLDQESADFVAEEYARGHSFFTYISDTVDSLSSCCRLRNMLTTKEFNFTNGNMGVQTGSKSVITLNLNRIIQDFVNLTGRPKVNVEGFVLGDLTTYLTDILSKVYKYHVAYNELLWDMYDANLLTIYKAGFIDLNKQYLTIGINGLNQAAEFLGMECNNNEDYKNFCKYIFKTISTFVDEHKGKEFGHQITLNVEQVPAESLALKNYNWDKEDGYFVGEGNNLYASYIFKPDDENISVLDKLVLHSKKFASDELSGGQAAHIGLAEHLSVGQYKKLLDYAGKIGCSYFTFNIPNCECDDCHFIAKQPFDVCPKCGSIHVSLYDRVIGYLTKIKNWSNGRQIEQKTRIYTSKNEVC